MVTRRLNIRARLALAIVVLGAVALAVFVALPPETAVQPMVSKAQRFSYTLTNTSPEFIASTEFSVHIPTNIPGTQLLESIVASEQYRLVDEGDHQGSITFNIENLPPYGSRVINVTFIVKKSTEAGKEKPNAKAYLQSEKYIEKDSQPVVLLAQRLSDENNFARSAFRWLTNNLKDAGYVAENKGALFAIEQRIGDCTEHMYAFIALARAHGIPARGVAGFVVESDAEIAKSSSYHNWAEFYDGEKWVIADSQRGIFDRDYQNYIAYRIIGGDEGQTSTSRFMAVDKRISIKL